MRSCGSTAAFTASARASAACWSAKVASAKPSTLNWGSTIIFTRTSIRQAKASTPAFAVRRQRLFCTAQASSATAIKNQPM